MLPPVGVRGVTSVSALEEAIVNREIVFSLEFATYKNFLEGCSASAWAPNPAVNGLLGRGVSTPELGSSR